MEECGPRILKAKDNKVSPFSYDQPINGGYKMQVASFDGYRRSFGTACYMHRVFSP